MHRHHSGSLTLVVLAFGAAAALAYWTGPVIRAASHRDAGETTGKKGVCRVNVRILTDVEPDGGIEVTPAGSKSISATQEPGAYVMETTRVLPGKAELKYLAEHSIDGKTADDADESTLTITQEYTLRMSIAEAAEYVTATQAIALWTVIEGEGHHADGKISVTYGDFPALQVKEVESKETLRNRIKILNPGPFFGRTVVGGQEPPTPDDPPNGNFLIIDTGDAISIPEVSASQVAGVVKCKITP